MKSTTRRSFLNLTAGTVAAHQIAPLSALAADSKDELPPLNRFPRMVHNYYLDQVIRAERRGLARKAALKTKADAEAYVSDVRIMVRSCFAPFPQKKSDLKARIVGTVERDTYRIEKLIFESRPGFLVTADVDVP